MTSVTCPSCGETGRLPDHLLSHRIKCKMCGQSFVPNAARAATEPGRPKPPSAGDGTDPAGFHGALESGPGATERGVDAGLGEIEVDGLDYTAWTLTEPEPAGKPFAPTGAATSSFAPTTDPTPGRAKRYKVLTQKDPWFKGRFDLQLLEEALNHYADQGWVVRSMATPHIAGFSGGPREGLVVLLER